jgi:ATP-binding cassette subfamily B protein
MDDANGAARSDRSLWARLFSRGWPYRTPLTALLLLEVLDGAWILLTPVPLKVIVDNVLGSRPLSGFLARVLPGWVIESPFALLVAAVGLLVALALAGNLQSLASTLLRSAIGERLVLAFRATLFRHAERLSLSYHDAAGVADARYRIEKDAAALENLLVDGVISIAAAALTLTLMFVVTLWIDWQIGLVALGVAPILWFLASRYKRRLRQESREVKKLESGALAVVQEVLAALRVVKAFGQEDRERDRFLRRAHDGMRARLRLVVAEGGYGLAVRMTTVAGTAAILFIGVGHVRAGVLTLGELLLVLAYLGQFYDPLKTISRKVGGLQAHLASAERAFALLDQPEEVAERPDARPLQRAAGAIVFRDVSFGYRDEHRVLRGLSFEIRPGARLGVVGPSGAGKTTLLHLLMRFHDPAEGRVLLDGRDLRDYRLADLRAQFALVLQDTVLFSATVAENIAYGRPTATAAEIEAAARAANAHSFIMRLPAGYATLAGERGMCLSGGERQRIALARAFLTDAPILLLDEPTSAVDVQTEADILEAMGRLMHGRTTLLVTHRPGPLSVCDDILVIDEGRRILPNSEEAPSRLSDQALPEALAAVPFRQVS